ncbi:MAG TPA: DUF1611 domain-containing protein [Planctomycetaceae bacterium]|nr:DUF1611 domain-containing protein [Planctomycetaceae bacterium]
MPDRMVVLTEGIADPIDAKFATAVLRYRLADVAGVVDSTHADRTCQEVYGIGGSMTIAASLDDVAGADTLLLGGAPPGGLIPADWRAIILQAVRRGMKVVSGNHEFLTDDPDFVAAARQSGAELIDLRKNDCRRIATGRGFRPECLRVHTVANSCACGKMTVTLELDAGLRRRGVDSHFVATGQIGIAIAANGLPIDRVIGDFISGAAEELVLTHQQHDVLLIEGQGSLLDCRYSAVTLGLLHGSRPDGLIYCYQIGRPAFGFGGPGEHPEPPIAEVIRYYETTASLIHPCRVFAVAVNGRAVSADRVNRECEAIEAELGLPACDVILHGPDKLVEATLALRT